MGKEFNWVFGGDLGYDPFGMELVGRNWEAASGYRYGFNGKEQDDEVSGNGNLYDYGFRIYNPRIGKFLSVDPLTRSFSMLTPYQYASNSPISLIDLDGLEGTAPAPPPANNALTNAGVPNRVLLPNTAHIEYTYYPKEKPNGETGYYRRSNVYNVPINRLSVNTWNRTEGSEDEISPELYENGPNWLIIGPYLGNPAPPPTPSNITLSGDGDGDIGSTEEITFAGTSGGSISGTFDPMGGGALPGIGNQITITDADGNMLFSSGYINTAVPFTVASTTSKVTITIIPNPSDLAGAITTAGDVDNYNLNATVTPNSSTSSATLVDSGDHPERVGQPEYENKRDL